MTPTPISSMAGIVTVALVLCACFLLALWWTFARVEQILREQAAEVRQFARSEAKAECEMLARVVEFRHKGVAFQVAEIRRAQQILDGKHEDLAREIGRQLMSMASQFDELTCSAEDVQDLVEEIAGIDGDSDPAADLLAKGM